MKSVKNKNKTDLSNDFKVEMPSTESENQGDLDFEKHLVKDIESSCNFNVYRKSRNSSNFFFVVFEK